MFKETVRFFAKILATPVIIVAFGVIWLSFVLLIGSTYWWLSFLMDDPFSWREHFSDCNQFFCEPLVEMWGKKSKLESKT